MATYYVQVNDPDPHIITPEARREYLNLVEMDYKTVKAFLDVASLSKPAYIQLVMERNGEQFILEEFQA